MANVFIKAGSGDETLPSVYIFTGIAFENNVSPGCGPGEPMKALTGN
jgi:hypothetical protein